MRSREPRSVRQVLLELELTSTARAHAFAPIISGSSPTSNAPNGDDTPAAYWRTRFAAAAPDEIDDLVKLAEAELRRIRRRAFPALTYDTADELAERVVVEGEGVAAGDVSVALRCTPTFVRRARIARGREPELGRVVHVQLEPAALIRAGLSLRQVSAVLGGPRSTLHERLARVA